MQIWNIAKWAHTHYSKKVHNIHNNIIYILEYTCFKTCKHELSLNKHKTYGKKIVSNIQKNSINI